MNGAQEANAPRRANIKTFPGIKAASSESKLYIYKRKERYNSVEVTKALAALQPLYGKDNIEIIISDGSRVRGRVLSMKMTQALTRPSVKIERTDGEVVKVEFDMINEIIDHNPPTDEVTQRVGAV